MSTLPRRAPDDQIQETQFSNVDEPTLAQSQPSVPIADQEAAAVHDANLRTGSSRAVAPDLLRGLLMMLQAIDHSSIMLGAWQHGVARKEERDGVVVDSWNTPIAWTARMATHLCAPGFMFLMGMGVVYFGRSRSKLGWEATRMLRHFAVRAAVLFLVNEAITLMTDVLAGLRVAILNIVLVALAVNYLLSGLIWMASNAFEQVLTDTLERGFTHPDDEATQPLLSYEAADQRPLSARRRRAVAASWHIINVLLLVLAGITVWWNHWLSPFGGHCQMAPETSEASVLRTALFEFWFYPITNSTLVMSPFPPLAWLSCAILGILYGRIVTAKQWTRPQLISLNVAAGAILMALFVSTRLLHFGNLTEDCLHMPEALKNPDGNQYLSSFRSFFYVSKYPPSVAFVSLTMSINFLLLALFTALSEVAGYIPLLLTFGQSALFFFVVHFPVYSFIGGVMVALFGHDLGYDDQLKHKPARGVGEGWLFWMSWALGIAILYPMCLSFSRMKKTKGPDSVWRFF